MMSLDRRRRAARVALAFVLVACTQAVLAGSGGPAGAAVPAQIPSTGTAGATAAAWASSARTATRSRRAGPAA